jgi:hypothetical protein
VDAAALEARPDCATATVVELADGRVEVRFDGDDWRAFDAALPATPEEAGEDLAPVVFAIPAVEWGAVLDAKASGTKAEIVAAIEAAEAAWNDGGE